MDVKAICGDTDVEMLERAARKTRRNLSHRQKPTTSSQGPGRSLRILQASADPPTHFCTRISRADDDCAESIFKLFFFLHRE